MKKSVWKIFLCCLLSIAFVFCGAGCKDKDTGYKGDFPDLYSEAIHSLLGVSGYHSHGDALIEIIEEDSFGRKLFSYSDGTGFNSYNLLVCQKSDETYVFFYPNYNFISMKWEGISIGAFSNEEIEALKNKNDWNKNLDQSKCIKIEIVRNKVQPELKIGKSVFEIFFNKVAESKGYNGCEWTYTSTIYFTSDSDGRMMYSAYGEGRGSTSTNFDVYLALIFNTDGTYNEETCIMELTDLYNYQDELKAFKELNNWNQPLS